MGAPTNGGAVVVVFTPRPATVVVVFDGELLGVVVGVVPDRAVVVVAPTPVVVVVPAVVVVVPAVVVVVVGDETLQVGDVIVLSLSETAPF
jgi:hypothetical protein